MPYIILFNILKDKIRGKGPGTHIACYLFIGRWKKRLDRHTALYYTVSRIWKGGETMNIEQLKEKIDFGLAVRVLTIL